MSPRAFGGVRLQFVSATRVRLLDAVTFEGYTLAPGTITDGATIPRLLWWVPMIGHPLQGDVVVPAAFHDELLRLRLTLTAMEAHRVFYRALRANGVAKLRAALFFAAVVVKNPVWRST